MKKEIINNPKQKVEHIKEDAKKYYKGKNMTSRYVFVGFLFILIILQFLLPSIKNNTEINTNEILVETSDLSDSKIEDQNMFLDHSINLNNVDYDNEFTNIISNLPVLKLLYKKSISILPEINDKFISKDIPTDFQYIALLNGLDNPIWDLSSDLIKEYDLIVNDDIDETLNITKSTDIIIQYLNDLYDNFEDWDLVLIAYFIGDEELEDIMEDQKQKEFVNLYLDDEVTDLYYKVVSYKYIIENISDYIDTTDIVKYNKTDTTIIKVEAISDLVKRSDKEGYIFKNIKELNPWILGNKLPKGKWDLEIENK